MTVGLASGIVNNWLDTDFATAGCFIKLHTGDPGSAGSTAAAAGDTSRKQATMASASGGSKAMSSMSGSWTNGGTSETLSHISIWSASTAGTFKGSAALSASQAWVSTNTFSLTSFSVAISPIAA
ncbi:MAG TPA: hypothetical protein VFW27_03475 [Actinoplanes sp.]|nr:hypothetical protein [Actinoplanes sp.]